MHILARLAVTSTLSSLLLLLSLWREGSQAIAVIRWEEVQGLPAAAGSDGEGAGRGRAMSLLLPLALRLAFPLVLVLVLQLSVCTR